MKKLFIVTTLCAVPGSLFAAVGLGSLSDFANSLATGVVTSLGYLFLSLAVVAFFWGIVQFIWAARQGSDGDGIKNGKQFMLWGLIALFVMFSVWGIITFVQDVFQIRGQTSITIPNIQLLGSSGASTNKNPSTFIQGVQPASRGCIEPNEIVGPDGACVSSLCIDRGANAPCTFSGGAAGHCDSSNRCVSGQPTVPSCTMRDVGEAPVRVQGAASSAGGCLYIGQNDPGYSCTVKKVDGSPVLVRGYADQNGNCIATDPCRNDPGGLTKYSPDSKRCIRP